MLGFLALLPRGLTTFLFAPAALLRFYGSSNSIPIPALPLTLLGWSLASFLLASAALLVDLGVDGTVEIEIELAKTAEIDALMDALWATPNSSSSQENPAEPG